MYIVVWKYKVKKENQIEFEFEYGKEGTWVKLFRTSDNYKGSSLHKNSGDYILIDTWSDKQSYDNFINLNSDKYENLSFKLEKTYDTEGEIGGFDDV
ncbi:MAG: hypothetical protein HRT66_05280 [Flavobacteriaceae bacterium]|nr:hypothetical protein [Flavobacteriaceae bacterium]